MKVYVLTRSFEYDNGDPECSENEFDVLGVYSDLNKVREVARTKILEEVDDRNRIESFDWGFLYNYTPGEDSPVWHVLKYGYFEQELVD